MAIKKTTRTTASEASAADNLPTSTASPLPTVEGGLAELGSLMPLLPLGDPDAATAAEELPDWPQIESRIRKVRDDGKTFYIANEYYWDSRRTRHQKTDAEYANDLYNFLGGDRNTLIIVDPSAASFKTELRNRGFRVQDAVNEVREGIATTAVLIGNRQLLAERSHCPNLLAEIHSYVWDEKASRRGEERPVKERDHAMDAMRYLCHTRTDRFRR